MPVVQSNRTTVTAILLFLGACAAGSQPELIYRLRGGNVGPISQLYVSPPSMSPEQVALEKRKVDYLWSLVEREWGVVSSSKRIDGAMPRSVGFGIGIGTADAPTVDGTVVSTYQLKFSKMPNQTAYIRVVSAPEDGNRIASSYLGLPVTEVSTMARVFEEFLLNVAPSLLEKIEGSGGVEAHLLRTQRR